MQCYTVSKIHGAVLCGVTGSTAVAYVQRGFVGFGLVWGLQVFKLSGLQNEKFQGLGLCVQWIVFIIVWVSPRGSKYPEQRPF